MPSGSDCNLRSVDLVLAKDKTDRIRFGFLLRRKDCIPCETNHRVEQTDAQSREGERNQEHSVEPSLKLRLEVDTSCRTYSEEAGSACSRMKVSYLNQGLAVDDIGRIRFAEFLCY